MSEFYQYYSSEIELLTIKADRNKKYATFLFPSAIAERDGFLNTYVNASALKMEKQCSNKCMYD